MPNRVAIVNKVNCEEVAVSIPAIEYHQTRTALERRFDPWAIAIVGGGVLMSVAIWGLAIAKIIDMFGVG